MSTSIAGDCVATAAVYSSGGIGYTETIQCVWASGAYALPLLPGAAR
jgi:hypothetical protein